MFGGMEMKVKSGGQDGGDSTAPSTSAVPPSGFGFLNSPPSAPDQNQAAAAVATASSFSFLNTHDPPELAAAHPAASASSSFSFMMEGAMAMPAAPAEASNLPPNDVSGFSFLIPSPSSEDAGEVVVAPGGGAGTTGPSATALEDNNDVASAATPPPGYSGFSFLPPGLPEPVLEQPVQEPEPEFAPSGPTRHGVQREDLPIPSIAMRDVSTGSAASSLSGGPSLADHGPPLSSQGQQQVPAWSGITFGTSAKRNVVKKKALRAQRVGSAATNTGPAAAAPAAAATTAAPAPPPGRAETGSARDAAAEAAQRAEAFMRAKSFEEARTVAPDASAAAPSPPQSSPGEGGTSSNGSSFSPPDIRPSASTDEVVAAAQAAAEEAKILHQQHQHQQHQKGGGFMGTFFKGFRASPTPTTAGPTGNSSHGGSSGSIGIAAEAGVDRLAREQQQQQQQTMTRGVADRPMRFQNEPKTQGGDDDDDDVVITTSVGGYRAEPYAPAPAASTFTPVTLPGVTRVTTIATNTTTPASALSSAFSSSSQTLGAGLFGAAQGLKISSSSRKMNTPKQTFEEYQALFAQSVHRAMDQVGNVHSQQKILREERFLALAKDRLATQQIAQTERQLQVAVEREDYELADQLGQVVEGHRREKHEVALMLENITKALAQLRSQKTLVTKSVATCFDNLSVRLGELKEKEAASEQKDDEETFKQFSLISKQLSTEQERLQQDLKHLERDEQLVGEERAELESSISEQSGEIEVRRDEASAKLHEVQEEVEELRRRLDLKQQEAADLRTTVYGFEDSISSVRVKFARQLTRVDKKERALKESRSEWELEDATHKRQKEAHELQVQSHSEALLVHDALMEALESELKLSKEFCEIIPAQLGFGNGDQSWETESDDGHEGDLAQLQADVVSCEAAVCEAKVFLKVATSAVANLQAERDGLVGRIPKLEEEKKAAAANRDFKSASKASKEIKDATTRIKECQEELEGEAMSKKRAAEEELSRLNEELLTSQEIAAAKEKIAGLQRMELLARQISQLIDKRKEICGECTSEENSVRGVGALVLEGQIKALQIEGQDLGSKFGGWTELMKEIQVEVTGASHLHADAEHATYDEDDEKEQKAPQEEMSGPADDGLTSEERVTQFRRLMAQINEAEKALDAAAAREDFDEAARLEEVFQSLQGEVETMNLTDEEAELAMQDEGTYGAHGKNPLPEQASSPGDVATPTTETETATSQDGPALEKSSSTEDEEKKETTEDTVALNARNADAMNDTEAFEEDAVDDGNHEDVHSVDKEEQTENGDMCVAKEGEFEGSPQNGEVANSNGTDPEEISLEVERNGDDPHPDGGTTKPDFGKASTPEESTLE